MTPAFASHVLRRLVLALAGVLLLAARPAAAQESAARRLSSIVGVAVEEYGKAVDERGRLVSAQEYQETMDFLRDAAGVADRLSGDRADAARRALDTLAAAVRARKTPAQVAALRERLATALGEEGALELPKRPVDVAAGRAIYERSCASCHGEAGLGDGPAARGMTPPPPALGAAAVVRGVSPALMYRIISVGVAGTSMASWAAELTPEQRWDVVAYITSLRSTRAQLLQGEGLYLQRCASCHGVTGAGDAVYARALSKLPPDVGTLAWQAEKSDSQIAAVVREGLAGTAMPASRDLTADETASLVAYLRSLPARGGVVAQAPAAADSADPAVAARAVLARLDEALSAARAGRRSDAGDRAFDAYLAFEPLETTTRAKNPGLIASMERHFADFKAAVRAGDVRAAERARDAVEAGLPDVVALMHPTASGWGAFVQSFLIILREGFEAILVIGAVVAFLLKTGHHERLRAIWLGVALAVAASAATAVVLATVLSAVPASREIIEGATLLVAVAVLFSVSYWLISKVEAAKWQKFIREKVTSALEHGGGRALAFVAFLAVYREGAETALFYQALFREGAHLALPLSLGIVAGAVALAVIFTLFYRFGVRIPLRPFFGVTSVLLYYMAFVFAGKGVRELQEGNAMSITLVPGLPTVEALGIYPTVETLLAQLLLLALFAFALLKTFWPKRSVALPTVPPATTDANERLAALEARIAALEADQRALDTSGTD